MAAKILKYAALPAAAAVGLGSLRIYSMNEKTNEALISPRELSIYSPDGPAVQFVEEQPGVVQTGLGAVRVGLQPYVRAVQSAFTSVEVGVISLYLAGQDTYHFLRDPPPGFLPRVGVIGVSGLGGLILARKGSRLKRIVVPLGLATAGTAVCYPTQTVAVLKITGKKVYTVSSSVASMLKSKPKEDVIMPAVSMESTAAVTSPDTEPPVSEISPECEPPPAVSDEEVTLISEAESVEFVPVADIVSEDAVGPPAVDLTTEIAAPLPEPGFPPALETAPATGPPPEPVDHTVRDAESTLESTLESLDEIVNESPPEPPLPEPVVKTVPEAASAASVEDTAPEPTPSTETDITPLVESDPEIVPEASPASPEFEVPAPTVITEEAMPSTTSTVEETTPPAPILPEDTTPTTVDEEPASVSPPPAEEALPLTPPPAQEAPPSPQPPVVEPATVKSHFVPDPSLLDHGQSIPEDADMYSTRS